MPDRHNEWLNHYSPNCVDPANNGGVASPVTCQLMPAGYREFESDPISSYNECMSGNSYLKDLVLLRNDASKIPLIRDAAARGEVDALYAMGLVYAEGRGVPVDLARAHYWLSKAIERGDRDADTLRNIVGSQMTDEEYAQARRLRDGPELEILPGGLPDR